MCIECSVEGSTARYVLRTLGTHKLGWMGVGFGRSMADSPMVVVWPSRGEDGNYNSVTLSQRKAPYEVMPKPDPHPPFVAKVSYINTWNAEVGGGGGSASFVHGVLCTAGFLIVLPVGALVARYAKVGGVGLVLLYVVQCAIGTRVHRIPVESRTGAQSALMAILGAVIVLLAFIETWLGLISAGRNMLVWSVLLS
ncbi:hypothetical protein EI94DRAFT_1725757, partial [Lactarius quietus]